MDPTQGASNEEAGSFALLLPPLYGHTRDGVTPYRPTLGEVFTEWVDAVNFLRHPSRAVAALCLAFHLATCVALVLHLAVFATVGSMVLMLAALPLLGTLYNTLWFHRYCSHLAFRFRHQRFTWLFLWTNPFFYREESYVMPHRVHHQLTEKPGDPYGPHLGWLGSYLGIESAQKLNIHLTAPQYERLRNSVRHMGYPTGSYQHFQRTGCIEHVAHFLARALVGQGLWAGLCWWLGGLPFVLGWYSAVFIVFFEMRDFNWQGHGAGFWREQEPGWELDLSTRALNQRFFGYVASEWHNNHHLFPGSARTGFLPGQVDLAFEAIRLMKGVGLVASYSDASKHFQRERERKPEEKSLGAPG